MYEPPENARIIPNNAVPEWYIGASRMCLLPDMKYGAENEEEDEADKKEKSKEQVINEKAKFSNIGANTGCQGSVLTLSLHAKQANVVKLYLYYNGQCIRFMPEDIKVVLPMLFNMNYGNNAEFIKFEKQVNMYIKKMSYGLQDEEFQAFLQDFK